jgi:hypothetical protein
MYIKGVFNYVGSWLSKCTTWKPRSEHDAPPNFWIDSTMSPKVKTLEGKWVGVCSLTRNISGVNMCVRALGWGLGWVTSGSIIHMDLHKQNNKLVSA